MPAPDSNLLSQCRLHKHSRQLQLHVLAWLHRYVRTARQMPKARKPKDAVSGIILQCTYSQRHTHPVAVGDITHTPHTYLDAMQPCTHQQLSCLSSDSQQPVIQTAFWHACSHCIASQHTAYCLAQLVELHLHCVEPCSANEVTDTVAHTA